MPPTLDNAASPPGPENADVPRVEDGRREVLRSSSMASALAAVAARRIDCSYRQDAEILEDMFRGAKRDRGSADEMERGLRVKVASRFACARRGPAGKSEMRVGVVGS